MTDKLDLESMNIAKDKQDKLKALFPEVFSEGKIDFDRLRATLGDIVDETNERYEMNWAGKKNCFRAIQEPSRGTLKPVKDDSVNFDTTENLYIEGDNLEVLKLLQKSYFEKVKMIYIDPPYNTGKDFVYPDDYKDNLKNYLELTGQVDSEGKKIKTNVDTDGRYHSNWMNMMYPRLFLARNLLREDGVIFISIDDNEVTNLRKTCDEIFGEENFVANIIWEKKFAPQNDAKWFSENHDHIICYGKSKNILDIMLLPRTEEMNDRYKNYDNDPRGMWTSDNLLRKDEQKSGIYTIVTPDGTKYNPPSGRSWRVSEEKFFEMLADNRIWFGSNGGNVPRIKRFLHEVQDGIKSQTIWKFLDVGHNQEASQELRKIFNGESYFDTPKPVRLIKKICYLVTSQNDIILDFFSGSATTAHAVMDLNAQDGGNRKFIMVQLPEPTDESSEAFKAGYKNICEIGKERIRRAGKKIKEQLTVDGGQLKLGEEVQQERTLDTGFRVFRLDKSNFNIWQGENVENLQQALFSHVEHIDKTSTEEDILFELILKAGYTINDKITEHIIEGKKVYSLFEDAVLISLEKNLTKDFIKAIADMEPLKVILLDEGFNNNDALKTNAVEIMKSKKIEDFRTV